jgi:hypothetical protein
MIILQADGHRRVLEPGFFGKLSRRAAAAQRYELRKPSHDNYCT